MDTVQFSLLRGICQTPAYVAHETGMFAEEGINSSIKIESTAWLVPERLASGESQFAVIPWTRAAAADRDRRRLVVIAGSGNEEAAIVVRKGLAISDVRRVALPLRGGMKDLTAMGLIESLGWGDVEVFRQPSGDGAIIAFFGQGVDAASMVEPYASMLEQLGVGYVARRTGDLWPGAPGCSLTTTSDICESDPALVRRVVAAYTHAAAFVKDNPDETAKIAHKYIGISPDFIRGALDFNLPRVDAVRNQAAMDEVLQLMLRLGYLSQRPAGYLDLSFLDALRA